MTISSLTNRNDYTGSNSTGTYNYTYKIFNENDLVLVVKEIATLTETTLTIATDYTVTNVGNSSGGTIVLVDNGQDWIGTSNNLNNTHTLTIKRVASLIQETDIRNQGQFFPEVIEDVFDRTIMISQQQQNDIDGSLKLPITTDPSTFDMTLPSSFVGQGSVSLITNEAGDGLAVGPSAANIAGAEAIAVAAAASAAASEVSNTESAASAAASEASAVESAASAVSAAAAAAALDVDAVLAAAALDSRQNTAMAGASVWLGGTNANTRECRTAAFGSGTFVGVTYLTGSYNKIVYSTTGETWTEATSNFSFSANEVIFGGGLFVIVGSGVSNNTHNIYTSPDGINWTVRTTSANHALKTVAYGNGIYVALNNSRHYTSADGLTWTERTGEIPNEDWKDICYDSANGVFIATGGFDPVEMATSPDGRAWTTRLFPPGEREVYSLEASDYGTVVASCLDDSMYYSEDGGITWALATGLSASSVWGNVCFGGGIFTATKTTGTFRFASSKDGKVWKERPLSNNTVAWGGQAYGNGRFIILRNTGGSTLMQYSQYSGLLD